MNPTFYRRLESAEKQIRWMPRSAAQAAASARAKAFVCAAHDHPATYELISSFMFRLGSRDNGNYSASTLEPKEHAALTDSELWRLLCERVAETRRAEGLPPLEPPPEFAVMAERADEEIARLKRERAESGKEAEPEQKPLVGLRLPR